MSAIKIIIGYLIYFIAYVIFVSAIIFFMEALTIIDSIIMGFVATAMILVMGVSIIMLLGLAYKLIHK